MFDREFTRRDYISDSTVRRTLAEANLKPRRPASGPNLEREHRVARLRYAREDIQREKNGQEFCLQMSLDSHFTLMMEGEVSTGDRERHLQACFSERVQYGGGSQCYPV
ncbi:Uncharacterized protein OBRU01_04318 [Operophtera brumata]|uniref:Transposase Tc1-like domain-containing protein n=1 Tax=Operophtera brumata TaxID=104452 RepID=A0A0L7LPE6_OPEBR|nr:Uncharacterized protein OBRU01_04318 [Operophtera brumata]